jgi:hypothetical protein
MKKLFPTSFFLPKICVVLYTLFTHAGEMTGVKIVAARKY